MIRSYKDPTTWRRRGLGQLHHLEVCESYAKKKREIGVDKVVIKPEKKLALKPSEV